MDRIKKFTEKNHALITVIGIVLLCVLLTPFIPNFIGLEGMLMFMLGFMSIFGIIGLLGETDLKNKIIFLVSLILSVGIFFHLKHLPTEQRQITNEFTIEETSNFYLLTVEGYKLLKLDKNEINFDDEHPLKLYEFYKTDIFGYELMPDLKVKSELMDDYVNPKILKY